MTRASYTVDFKLSVVEWVNGGERSLREASKTFGVDRKCIRQWVRECSVLGSARLRQGPLTRKLHCGRGPLSRELDQLVLGYLLEARRRGTEAEDSDLKRKAVEAASQLGIEGFKASPSWLRAWKARTGVEETKQRAVELAEAPVGSALISHISRDDCVRLGPIESTDCSTDDSQTPSSPHVTSHVITPDHTYCRRPPADLVSSSLKSTSPSYSELLRLPMGGHLLESADQLNSLAPYGSMCVPSSDPVMSSTQALSELDMAVPLSHEMILPSDESATSLSLPLLPGSPSLSSLSPPKRSSVDSRFLLWPSFGCTRTSPVTFPEFHDFTDPLTGLLANRRSQPVFPARPEILMSHTELI